jgi:hypothetical protein
MNNVHNITAACFRRGSQTINCKLMEGICSALFHLKRQQLQELFTVACALLYRGDIVSEDVEAAFAQVNTHLTDSHDRIR